MSVYHATENLHGSYDSTCISATYQEISSSSEAANAGQDNFIMAAPDIASLLDVGSHPIPGILINQNALTVTPSANNLIFKG